MAEQNSIPQIIPEEGLPDEALLRITAFEQGIQNDPELHIAALNIFAKNPEAAVIISGFIRAHNNGADALATVSDVMDNDDDLRITFDEQTDTKIDNDASIKRHRQTMKNSRGELAAEGKQRMRVTRLRLVIEGFASARKSSEKPKLKKAG